MVDGPPVPGPPIIKPAKPVLEVRAVVPLVALHEDATVGLRLLSAAMASELSDGGVLAVVAGEGPVLRIVAAMELLSESDWTEAPLTLVT